MRLIRLQAMGGAILLAAMSFTTGILSAKDGRDFAGYYSLANVDEQENQVEVTLVLQLFNHSGSDLKQAVVLVRASLPRPGTLARLEPILEWANGRDVILSQRVAISRDEYQRWSARTQPGLFVVYTDDAGREWRQPAQLSRRPTIPERTPFGRAAGVRASR